MRRLLPLVAVAAAAIVLAGCGSSHKAEVVPRSAGQNLTLPPTALRPPFSIFDRGKQGFAYQGPGEQGDPRRFGRVSGWVARYHRPGTRRTRGPLVIDSNADVFKDANGAERDFASLRTSLSKLYPQAVAIPALGEEAAGRTLKTGSGQFAVRYYTVIWRDRNVVAALTVNGFEGKVALTDALRLARVQERRIVELR